MEGSSCRRSTSNGRKQTGFSPFTTFTTTFLASIAGKGLCKVSKISAYTFWSLYQFLLDILKHTPQGLLQTCI